MLNNLVVLILFIAVVFWMFSVGAMTGSVLGISLVISLIWFYIVDMKRANKEND